MKGNISYYILAFMALVALSGAQVVGTSAIHAPAVILSNNSGSITQVDLTVSTGTGNVVILGPSSVGNSTLQSARMAAEYASSYLGMDFNKYNFTYTIADRNASVSGPSAGAAMTLLAVSALSGKPLRTDFTITGTISPDGTLGEIGGVYDKASAARNDGFNFILVPEVPNGSQEDELYLLVQQTFNIPLIQVANITGALHFALYNSSVSGISSSYNPFTDYHASNLSQAPLACTNCNYSIFQQLTAFTFNLTSAEIANVSSYPGFGGISANFTRVLNQSVQISGKGYQYTAADIAFLDYLNSFYFANHLATADSALATMDNINASCSSLAPPQVTRANYEYVIGAELRQSWGSYTLSQEFKHYNTTNIDTDQVLDFLFTAGEANAWCSASGFLYNASAGVGGTPVSFSPSLRAVAASRIRQASLTGPNLYSVTALQAYKAGNYPLAIIDSDYAVSIYNTSFNGSTANLTASANAIASNATYGIWATQFANEAEFYIQESQMAHNSTVAHTYAVQAYSSSVLAGRISNDTKLIYGSMTAAPAITADEYSSLISSITKTDSAIATMYSIIYKLAAAIIILLGINVIVLILVLRMGLKGDNAKRGRRR